MLKLLRVAGDSMAPDFQEGDFVLVSKIPFLFRRLRPGDVIVFRHPNYGTLIKTVAALGPAPDEVLVTGIAPASVDSRKLGAIPLRAITGKVIWHARRVGPGRGR